MEAMSDAQLLDLLLDRRIAIPAIVVRDGRIASWNAAAHELLGGDVGRPVEALFDAGSRRKLAEAMAAAPASCEVQVRPRGNEAVPARVAAVPLGPTDHLLLVAGIAPEYSELMARQLLVANDHLATLTRDLARQSVELEAARTRFESLAELREHFVSMLAHDVRGALQGIVLNAEVIGHAEASGATETLHKALQRIRGNATRVVELVEKVLETARTETGRITLDARPLSLRAVARETIEIYAPIADAESIRLELVDHAGDALVPGDRVRLGQVLGNLVENALRHSPARGIVTLELSATPEVVRLAVRDQGPGIPPELRERIFERFVRGRGTGGSLGLGLYVARQLVELHHGRILVEDVAPHGASLVIEIPRSRTD